MPLHPDGWVARPLLMSCLSMTFVTPLFLPASTTGCVRSSGGRFCAESPHADNNAGRANTRRKCARQKLRGPAMEPLSASGRPGSLFPLYAPQARTNECFLEPCEEGVVTGRVLNPLDQPLHARLRRHLLQPPAEREDRIDLVRAKQHVLAPSSARRHIDRGENALFRKPPSELDLAVARSLELLEDHVVHSRAG